jgi:murein DD-endopeptidase MepM/ murein hydrolase activator NlpD
VFENLSVQFAPWDRATNRAGAFLFTTGKQRVFYEFGLPYSSPQGTRINGTFVYDVVTGSGILAPMAGLVTRLEYQAESDDYEVEIRTSQASDWSVSLDHLRQVTVRVGDRVQAGQVLGTASMGVSGHNTMPELQINEEVIDDQSTFERRVRSKTFLHCPTKFVSSALAAQVLRLMADWEAFTGATIYGQARSPYPGCTTDKLSP